MGQNAGNGIYQTCGDQDFIEKWLRLPEHVHNVKRPIRTKTILGKNQVVKIKAPNVIKKKQ